MLTKKQKRQLGQLLLAALAIFIVWVLVFFNITAGEETAEFVVKNINWTTKFVNNLQANWVFYLMAIGVLGSGYLLVTGKKRR